MNDILGRTLLNRYRLDALIGEGGMARVYRATDLMRGATVAVKVLREDLAEDREFVRRFRKEAQTLAQLNHPNIVRFYEFGNEGHRAFLVMDYVDGITLRRHILDANAPLAPELIRNVVRDVGSALGYAHSQGIIHRDVKPGNIMLARDGRILLSDFGIAKMADSATITTVAPGTPAYSSPEQVLSRPLDYRTDIYSFGIVLYEMATGQRPFNGDTAPETLASTTERIRWEQVKGAPADPCRLNPGLPLEVARVIGLAMQKEPGQRWQTMGEMIAALERASAGMVNDIPSSPTLASWKQAGVQVVDRFEWKPPAQEPVAPVQPAVRSAARGMTPVQWGALTVLAAAVIVVLAQAFSIWSDVRMQAAEATAIARATSAAIARARETAEMRATLEAYATSTAIARARATAAMRATLDARTTKTIEIYATTDWQDTGMYFQQDENIVVKYLSGQWSTFGDHLFGPDGRSIEPVDWPDNVLRGYQHGSLIGKIEEGMPFYIGRGIIVRTDRPGNLFLQINDKRLSDNSGSVTVSVGVNTTDVPTTFTPRPAPMRTATRVPATAGATPRAGDTRAFAPDNAPMQFVPAGEFTMGSNDGDNEKPIHIVYLDAFWMDKFEVTNALYKKCVDAGRCSRPSEIKSYTRSSYFGNAQYDNYPVIYVNWEQAKTYCEWAGKRLPTEAEWEKAARGTDGRIYPWGNTFDASKLNSADGNRGDTTQVGAYLSGASPYGIMDLAGNVWEWVADWYDEKYYASSPRNNPTGPSSGSARALRGGAWLYPLQGSRATSRIRYNVTNSSDNDGFRCARSP